MQSEAVAVTLRVTQVLDNLQVPYVIGGSMASTAHGRLAGSRSPAVRHNCWIRRIDQPISQALKM